MDPILSITIHESKRFAAFRLKALVWSDFGLEYPENLRSQSGNSLATLWKKYSHSKSLIINCKGISVIDQHALEDVKRHVPSATHPLVFVSDSANFLGELEHSLGKPTVKVSLKGNLSAYAYASKVPQMTFLRQLILESYDLEREDTKAIVKECFERHRGGGLQRMHSTPFLSSGLFNARALIGAPAKFTLIVLQLVDALEALLQEHRPANPCILAVSLRGGPIAAATAFLASTKLDVEIIDHMGPKQSVLEGYSFRQQKRDISYIYIGDFVIGGTELKVASSYASALGSRVRHGLAIGTLLPRDSYGGSILINSLVLLTECRSDLRYELLGK